MKNNPTVSRRSIRRHLIAGVAVVVLLAGGVGGWASTTQFAGAVIAIGSLVVDSNIKKVQHLTGGIVGELRVHDGDRVNAGDVVVRLDDTVTRANLAIVKKGLDELVGRKARLESERDGRQTIKFPDEMLARKSDPEVAHVIESESKLFELRRSARQGQKAQFRERIQQLQEEARGLVAQQGAKDQELGLIGRELAGVKELWSKNLIQLTRLTALEREEARLQGERGQLIASAAQIKGKIAETELQIIQLDQDLSSDVAKEMREIEAKIGEFVERKVTAEDQLKRVDIRAPQDGTVFQLAVHTVGAGGGSIGWRDPGGALRVGPDRDIRQTGVAGAVPVNNATLHADIIKISALGTNGTVNIGNGNVLNGVVVSVHGVISGLAVPVALAAAMVLVCL